MATYTINYAFTIDDTVWFIDGEVIVEAIIRHIKIEIDPDDIHNIVEKITYYVDPIYDKKCDILEHTENTLFPSLEDLLDYRLTNIKPELPKPHSQDYHYLIGDTVWVIEGARALESNIIQITINVGKNNNGNIVADVWYHVLPISEKYSVRILKFIDIFETKQDAKEKILADRESGLTPTPTVTPEVTPTPSATPSITPTPTPTATPSVLIPAILLEDGHYLLAEDAFPILLE